jgi:hypothetical protein
MNDQSTTVGELKDLVARFVDERNWRQFHTPKNLAMSIAVEAAELMERPKSRKPSPATPANVMRSAKSWPTSSATPWRWPTRWNSTWPTRWRGRWSRTPRNTRLTKFAAATGTTTRGRRTDLHRRRGF